MLIIVTQLDEPSTPQLQGIYKYLLFKYLLDSLSLLRSFLSWHLLVSLTMSKPIVNKVLIIIKMRNTKILETAFFWQENI